MKDEPGPSHMMENKEVHKNKRTGTSQRDTGANLKKPPVAEALTIWATK